MRRRAAFVLGKPDLQGFGASRLYVARDAQIVAPGAALPFRVFRPHLQSHCVVQHEDISNVSPRLTVVHRRARTDPDDAVVYIRIGSGRVGAGNAGRP